MLTFILEKESQNRSYPNISKFLQTEKEKMVQEFKDRMEQSLGR